MTLAPSQLPGTESPAYVAASVVSRLQLFPTTTNLFSTSLFCSVQSLSCVRLCEPMDCTCQASLSITSSQSLLKLMSIELVMPSNDLLLCHPLLLSPSIFLSIRIFFFFKISQFFSSGGQSIGVSSSGSILPINIQD